MSLNLINKKRKVLFIDRDGTLVKEPPVTHQLDDFSKLEFYPFVFTYLAKIAAEGAFELVMVTNQDGLGTDSFPENTFWPCQNFIIQTFKNEGITFSNIYIDKSLPHEKKDTRKPGIGMLKHFLNDKTYDMSQSFVIGDRITDVELAKNMGCRAIFLNNEEELGVQEATIKEQELNEVIALETTHWKQVYEYLQLPSRIINHSRNTNETQIQIQLNLDGSGRAQIETGLGFFNHMLEQVARHSGMDIILQCKGDLHIDEHHTIEDTALALGEAMSLALGDKKGIERYGFSLPMDDCLAQVAIDFGGRNWLEWKAVFLREKIGEMPTEMFYHFFKSFSDASKSNLNISAVGINEHHKIEAIFKAFAKSIKQAIKRDPQNLILPTTKGVL